MKKNNKYLLVWYVCVALLIGAFFIILKKQRDNILFSPIKKPKAVSVVHKKIVDREPEVYAGRFDEVKKATYNSLGLPEDRYWLTSKEWHGKHIKNMPINNAKKRMLLTRFKTWKKLHIKSFIDEMLRAAIEEHKTFPEIPPSLIVAQAIIETNFGLVSLQ
jgi:hypothetical protein